MAQLNSDLKVLEAEEKAISKQKASLAKILSLLQEDDPAVDSGAAKDVIRVEQEMKRGLGSQMGVEGLMSRQPRQILGPNVHPTVSSDVMTQTLVLSPW